MCRTPSSGRLARSAGVLRKRSSSDGEYSTAQVCLSSLEHPSTSRYLPGPATKGLHAVSYAFVKCLGAICVSAAPTRSLCKSACVYCWSVLCDGVLIVTLLRYDSRSVAATSQPTSLTHLCLLQSNIDNTTNWALSDEEYKAITGIKHQLRLLDGCPWLHEVGPYRYSFPY